MSCGTHTVRFNNERFSCSARGLHVVHLGPASDFDVPNGIITDGNGTPNPRLLFVVLSSCTWTENGEIDRLSPAFLGLLLRCFAAQFMPSLEFNHALARLTTDPNLLRACVRTMCHTRTSPGKTTSTCGSVYHEPGIKSAMDPRSRSNVCARCFAVEDNLRKATWPLVSTLQMRLLPNVFPEILKALQATTREAILKSVKAHTHDLFLSNLPLKATGHWLYRATPYAATLLSLQRSAFKDKLIPLIPTVVARGWAILDTVPKRKKIGDHLTIYESILYSREWHNVVALTRSLEIELVLVSPTYPGDRIDSWTIEQLAAAVEKGTTSFCGCTVPHPGQALNFLLDAASCNAVTVANVDERHFYAGDCPATRKHLDDEASGAWKRDIPTDVKTLMELIRTGRHERQGVQAALRGPAPRRKRCRKEGEAHGKKPSKRAAVSAKTAAAGGTGGAQARGASKRADGGEEGDRGAAQKAL